VKLYHDLEKSPLKIKTDSTVGSDKKMAVIFYSAEDEKAGGLYFDFNATVQYRLSYCNDVNSWTILTETLPSTPNKVLSITLTRSTDVRLKVDCNKEEVLNVQLSDTSCGNKNWNMIWSRNVEKIEFTSYDTASDFYIPGE
jgi:hypothetical protein